MRNTSLWKVQIKPYFTGILFAAWQRIVLCLSLDSSPYWQYISKTEKTTLVHKPYCTICIVCKEIVHSVSCLPKNISLLICAFIYYILNYASCQFSGRLNSAKTPSYFLRNPSNPWLHLHGSHIFVSDSIKGALCSSGTVSTHGDICIRMSTLRFSCMEIRMHALSALRNPRGHSWARVDFLLTLRDLLASVCSSLRPLGTLAAPRRGNEANRSNQPETRSVFPHRNVWWSRLLLSELPFRFLTLVFLQRRCLLSGLKSKFFCSSTGMES